MCFCLIQVSIPCPLWNLPTDDLSSFFGAFAEDTKHNHKNRENPLISFISDRTWHKRESIGMLRRLVNCLTLLLALPCSPADPQSCARHTLRNTLSRAT